VYWKNTKAVLKRKSFPVIRMYMGFVVGGHVMCKGTSFVVRVGCILLSAVICFRPIILCAHLTLLDLCYACLMLTPVCGSESVMCAGLYNACGMPLFFSLCEDK